MVSNQTTGSIAGSGRRSGRALVLLRNDSTHYGRAFVGDVTLEHGVVHLTNGARRVTESRYDEVGDRTWPTRALREIRWLG